MIVKYWGVRGSMPSPGKDTVRYGGNTACVSIEIGDNVVIIGAGTGIRAAGKALVRSDKDIIIMVSHLHYDHVMGFPLFGPLFQSGRVIQLVSYPSPTGPWTPLKLMDGIHWPITPTELSADVRIVDDPQALLAKHGIALTTINVNHPGGALGFKIAQGDQVFVHVPDNELDQSGEPTLRFDQMVEFCRGANVLSHDAQYLDREMPHREGWGHSLAMSTCRLAIQAGVRHLVLFHHDPDRTDDEMDRIGQMASDELEPHGIVSTIAYEGLSIDLSNPGSTSLPVIRPHDID